MESGHRTYERVTPLGEVDLNDPVALVEARAQKNRDEWVAIMGTRMLREQLRECYQREGVNHYKNCRELALAMVERVKEQSSTYKNWDQQAHPSK